MTETILKMLEDGGDVMSQIRACTTCFSKFTFGSLRGSDFDCSNPLEPIIICPTCKQKTVEPADGRIIEIKEPQK